jgi:hypothetical protein
MPRSTRARVRSSQSQSQSLSTQPVTRRTRATTRQSVDAASQVDPPQSQSQASFASGSTASLPKRYVVSTCHVPGHVITTKEREQLHLKGAEFISDGWRRGEKEGITDELKEVGRKRRSVIRRMDQEAEEPLKGYKLDLGVLWYTAPLIYPRTSESRLLYTPPFS